jgi:multidrug efflux pump subunit AcrA (membrane-fusion protein)
VGEQNPKSDAKVFEVSIQINEKDTTLRPSMTTGNNIVVGKLKNVLFIPLEAIHHDGDSLTYTFIKDGLSFVKREIKIGQTNENNAVVKEGLSKGEIVYLSMPEETEKLKVEKLKGKAKK